MRRLVILVTLILVMPGSATCGLSASLAQSQQVEASSSCPESPPSGPMDGDRFVSDRGQAWQGRADSSDGWWWQITFSSPHRVGSILQINGEAGDVLLHVPRDYVWQYSSDGASWTDLPETNIANECRAYRIHRLQRSVEARLLRLRVAAASSRDAGPIVREVEFYPEPDSKITFPDWLLSVNITDRPGSQDGLGHLKVLRGAMEDETIRAQHVDVSIVTPDFVAIEPRPLAMFLSGSYKDWCEVDRNVYQGVERILTDRTLPIWGSCGGCQLLAILAETGTRQAWDCPHCRDPQHPRSPIYTHIHCANAAESPPKCGVYDLCEFERGPYVLRIVRDDPVLARLPADGLFTCQESHCGQIAYLPKGWSLLVTRGPNGKTENQLMKVDGYPIYAAQFHIDMGGEHAEILAKNFLQLARHWKR